MNRNLLIGLLAAVAAAQLSVPAWMIWRHENVLDAGWQYKFRTAPVDPADPFRGRYVALRLEATTAPIPAEPSVANQAAGVTNVSPVMSAEIQDLPRGMKVYALLKEDPDGFARFAGISFERPKEGDYIQAPISWAQDYDSYARRWDFQPRLTTETLAKAPEQPTTETLAGAVEQRTTGTASQAAARTTSATARQAARKEKARAQAMQRAKDGRSNKIVVTLDLPFDRFYMGETVAPHAETAYRQHSVRQQRDTYLTVRVKSGDAVIENLYIAGKPIGEYAREEMKKEDEEKVKAKEQE
ncbi:MAG: GDYXXLXY domain-containing protein [Candidatus Sumerlaeota bacterium]|nr:GDYXXLXY domain-containing protein [Candidatus Sumerlaeota bacterium]